MERKISKLYMNTRIVFVMSIVFVSSVYGCCGINESGVKCEGQLYVGKPYTHKSFQDVTVIDFRWSLDDSISVCEVSSSFTGKGRGYSLSIASDRKEKGGKYYRMSYPDQLKLLKEAVSYMKKEKGKDHLKRIYVQMSALGDAGVLVSNKYKAIKPAEKAYDRSSYQRALEKSLLISDIKDLVRPFHQTIRNISFELVYNVSTKDLLEDVILNQLNYPDTVELCDDLCIELL